jgi:hypothetical protein
MTYECPVRHWLNNEIRAVIPAELNSIVREREVDGSLYIQPFERNREAMAAITILPNPVSLVPAINTLSDSQIRGGQLLIIEGNNFLDSRGTVEFRFGSRVIPSRINEWNDSYIAVELEAGITGLAQTAGHVSVTNIHGESASRGITFMPRITSFGLQKGSSDLAFYPVAVNKSYVDFNFELINGWRVVDNYVQVASHTVLPGSTYYVDLTTWAHGTHAKSVRSVFIAGYGRVSSWNHLFIEGPEGLPYRE